MRAFPPSYRLVGLDGEPHPVLDALYDNLDLALDDATVIGLTLACSSGDLLSR